MKKIILIVLFIILIVASVQAVETDKIAHATVSAILYDFTYDVLRNETELSIDHCEGIAFWGALSIGVGKELYDEYYSETGFNQEDLTCDIGGIVASILFNRYCEERKLTKLSINATSKSFGVKWKF